MREPLIPGRSLRFRWPLRASTAGKSRGVVWLFIEFVPRAGGEVQKEILLSRPVVLEVKTILGMPARVGRWVGGMGLAGSALLLTGWYIWHRQPHRL
jgi:hypothetical protein